MIFSAIDSFLDRITMYRVVLYYLIAILVVALLFSVLGMLPFSAMHLLSTTLLLLVACLVSNIIFSKVFDAATNIESTYITALILACIIPPIQSSHDIPLIIWSALLATATKYILAIRNKHVFNPAAIAVVLTAFWLNYSADWWVGTTIMIPIVVLGGTLMVRKMHRYDLLFSFFVTSILTVGFFTITGHQNIGTAYSELLLKSPLFFFAFVMLTEPLTTPPTKFLQAIYGGIVGILFAPQVHIGIFYFTPELALVFGNVFSYLASPKVKERLTVTANILLGGDIREYIFNPSRQFSYNPGQYMEFTLPHARSDSRGNRRYFTLASSPTESHVLLGVKFYEPGSSFKQKLRSLTTDDSLMAGQIAGDFTLPKNPNQKLAFVAGGIGITPFRSMLKYLTDTNEQRDIALYYSNKHASDAVYTDVFSQAAERLGTKLIYTFTATMPKGWTGNTGPLTAKMIQKETPDFLERIFYISGPHAMVASVEQTLQTMGIKPANIKKDFFPGLV